MDERTRDLRNCSRVFSDKLLATITYLIGVGFIAHYAFTTNYQSVYDAERLMYIIDHAASVGYVQAWRDLNASIYWLQLTSVGMIIPPVWLHHILGISTSLAAKIYCVVAMPLVPAIVYYIARIKLTKMLAFAASMVLIGQVTFIQGPSFGRFIIAMIPFALLMMVVLRATTINRRTLPVIIVLTAAISLIHYGAAMVSLAILLVTVICILVLRRFSKERLPVRLYALSFVFLVAFFCIWHLGVNDSVMGAYRGTARAIESGDAAKVNMIDYSKPDKIIQVAFGSKSPDGDNSIQVNKALFGISWAMIGFLGLGLLVKAWKRDINAVTIIAAVMVAMCIGTVMIPYLSRIYGIERTYFHASTITAGVLVYGISCVAKTVRLRAEYAVLPVVMAYMALSYRFGMIVSLAG